MRTKSSSPSTTSFAPRSNPLIRSFDRSLLKPPTRGLHTITSSIFVPFVVGDDSDVGTPANVSLDAGFRVLMERIRILDPLLSGVDDEETETEIANTASATASSSVEGSWIVFGPINMARRVIGGRVDMERE